MTKRTRRAHSAVLKAKVALAAASARSIATTCMASCPADRIGLMVPRPARPRRYPASPCSGPWLNMSWSQEAAGER